MKKLSVFTGKSLKSKGFGWIFPFFCFLGVFLTSCATQYSEKMYADVIGFNDTIMPSYLQPSNNQKDTDVVKPIPGVSTPEGRPYNLLNQIEANAMKNAIERIPSGQNTAALYALDIGLDRITEINRNYMERDPNSRYYIVFFTDGIDNASVDMAIRSRRGNYPRGSAGREAYGIAMQNRMRQILKRYNFLGIGKPNTTNSFQSYVLLFRGDDLASYNEDTLATILSPFTASQNAPTPDVIMDRNMNTLLEKFKNEFVIPTFSFSVPKDYVGRRVRMQLNTREDMFFEADLRHQVKRKWFKKIDYYTLEDITVSNEFTFKEFNRGIVIEMDKDVYDVHSNTVSFTINELKLGDKSFSVRRNEVSQWHHDYGNWVKNTEYTGTGGGKKNAYILLIMDTSLSLGANSTAARRTAGEIISFISEQM